MRASTRFSLFLAAALLLAVAPGPGLFYVASRTSAGGCAEGMASSIGTGPAGACAAMFALEHGRFQMESSEPTNMLAQDKRL